MLKENKTYLPLQKTQNNIQDLNFPSLKKKKGYQSIIKQMLQKFERV